VKPQCGGPKTIVESPNKSPNPMCFEPSGIGSKIKIFKWC
jgi:hypothetical protein